MDIIFNCPKCQQELEVDSQGAGSEINCPSCGETLTIPQPGTNGARVSGAAESRHGLPTFPNLAANPSNPMATSAAAKIEMHLKVPVRSTPAESIIQKPLKPLEVAAKETDKRIRVRAIRHSDCIEVGHDRFEEMVGQFLEKVGEANVISMNVFNYTHLDIGSQKLMTEYGLMIIYRG